MTEHENEDLTAEKTAKETDTKAVEYPVEGQEKPLLKDAKTGKFIKGTGSSGKGGRKPGSRDRVSQQLVDIAQSLMERRGAELLEEVADRAPEQALALITKIIPATELTRLFEQDRQAIEAEKSNHITISLVGGNAPTNNRLGSTVERLTSPDDDLEMVVPEPSQEPTEAPLGDPIEPVSAVASEPTQADMDAVAAREARERQARQNEVIRQYGGLTGRKPRGSSGNGIEYPDDGGMI